jgi:hypothetical protein
VRDQPQPGFRITEITAFTTIGDDDEEGILGVPMGDTMMPLIAADITRLTQLRDIAAAYRQTFGIDVRERVFRAVEP